MSESELDLLKNRATLMGIKFHTSISLAKLKEKIENSQKESQESAPVVELSARQLEVERRNKLRREATKLIRVRVTCMNPDKSNHPGEIITVSNSVIGTVKKFVPFNGEPYHIEQAILNVLEDRKYQAFVTRKTEKGNDVKEGRQIKEFAIEVLPPLTEQELKDLANQQAMAKNID